MKLTKRQQEVIDYMSDGWALGASHALSSHIWLQKDGLGRGGDCVDVHAATFNGLHRRGMIVSAGYGFPTTKYVLTEAGKVQGS